MAAARLMTLHTSKGRTVGIAISDILDYDTAPTTTRRIFTVYASHHLELNLAGACVYYTDIACPYYLEVGITAYYALHRRPHEKLRQLHFLQISLPAKEKQLSL